MGDRQPSWVYGRDTSYVGLVNLECRHADVTNGDPLYLLNEGNRILAELDSGGKPEPVRAQVCAGTGLRKMQFIAYFLAGSVVLSVVIAWVWKLRFHTVRPFLGLTVVSGIHLFSVYYFLVLSRGLRDAFVIYAIAQASSRPITVTLNRLELSLRQKNCDLTAKQAMKDEFNTPFALYLRPFKVTDRLGLQGISSKWGGIDIEVLLAEACQSWGELLALGKEGESIGAGRLRSDDESWRSSFYLLAKKASVIILIPAPSERTFFEIEWIKDNMFLEKTIFVMPPETVLRFGEMIGFSSQPQQNKDYAESWSLLQMRSEEIGLRFPVYDKKGGLVEFKNNSSLYAQCVFEGPSMAQVRSIRKLLHVHLRPKELT
jgi:hypothetical protein